MRKAIPFACLLLSAVACSRPQPNTAKTINPPIYIATDPKGELFFGPVSQTYSLSDGRNIPGTDHSISVYCSSLNDQEATLTFQELAPGGTPVREVSRQVPLGIGFTFQIFDTVNVTIKNRL